MYVVSVTFGNAFPLSRFASGIKSRDDAETLKKLAVSLGYRDAEVWDAKVFKEHLLEKQRSAADKKAAARERGKVRDMRPFSPKPI